MDEVESDNESNQSIPINEYLDDIEKREMETDLVLGGDDGDECTYSKGYLKRQAIFSCLTCTPEGNAGICTGCCLSCHDGHKMVELWTKRNFRCDCGNSKFGNFICKLQPSKDIDNTENLYNHNFKGTYCTCDRPYPDPSVKEDEEMVQCCVCEDWYHSEHLGLDSSERIPVDDEGEALYEDLICPGCSATCCSFFAFYSQSIFVAPDKHEVVANDEKGKGILEEASPTCASTGKIKDTSCDHMKPCNSVDIKPENVSGKENLVSAEVSEKALSLNECSQHGSSGTSCQLGIDLGAAPLPAERNKAIFLVKNWRDTLCRCVKCSDFYKLKCVSFLLDKDDSIAEYVIKSKQSREERLQKLDSESSRMFDNLGHVAKVEIASGIVELKNAMANFFATHDKSQSITPADVHELFDNLKKKRRREM